MWQCKKMCWRWKTLRFQPCAFSGTFKCDFCTSDTILLQMKLGSMIVIHVLQINKALETILPYSI